MLFTVRVPVLVPRIVDFLEMDERCISRNLLLRLTVRVPVLFLLKLLELDIKDLVIGPIVWFWCLSILGSLSSTRTQLDLLEQLTSTSSPADGYESDGSSGKLTIRDQLARLVGDRDDDFSIPLGKKNLKKVSANFLTVSQKRNIRRQAYLNEVSQRNDSVFFATIGAFIILPPTLILGIAIIIGYVQLFPWYYR